MTRILVASCLLLAVTASACGGTSANEEGTTYSRRSRPRHSRAVTRYRKPDGTYYAAPAYKERNEDYEDMPALETLRGQASYYHDSLAGNHTANGEVYDPALFTCANRTLPFGTMLRVTRIDNGLQVIVRVNDRGPFGSKKRILDLSRAAAERLQMGAAGVIQVRVEVLKIPE